MLIPAILRRSNRDESGMVMAWRVRVDGDVHYTRFRVIEGPSNSPDGEYAVVFDGIAARTEKRQGQWAMTVLGS
jgi:hypothetical protein